VISLHMALHTLFARTQPSESHSIENTSTNGSHFPSDRELTDRPI